jgi:succinate dehydrogenase / fumarate reductase membrane anchor subunit
MAYVTDRKRAEGLGSAKTGTEHFWRMQVSSVALLVLVPAFVFVIGPVIGAPYEEAAAYLGRLLPALIAGLALIVGLIHFRMGAQVMIEDYAHGLTRKFLVIATISIAYGALAVGLFALARLAL